MNSDWSRIPRFALRIIVLVGLMYAVGLPLIQFVRDGDLSRLASSLLLGLGAVALLPVVLFVRRALLYLEFYLFWWIASGAAIAALVFGAYVLDLLVGARGAGLPIAIVLLVVGVVWWVVSRERSPRGDAHHEPPAPPANMRPRRPAPGVPDPERINKELAARVKRNA
jgi:hypothetical protein